MTAWLADPSHRPSNAPRPRVPMLATATGVLVLCSTGLPSVVEPVARFTTSYVIVGFVDAIAGDGVPALDVDARFFWPAFFAQWAWFRDASGAGDLDVVLNAVTLGAASIAVWLLISWILLIGVLTLLARAPVVAGQDGGNVVAVASRSPLDT